MLNGGICHKKREKEVLDSRICLLPFEFVKRFEVKCVLSCKIPHFKTRKPEKHPRVVFSKVSILQDKAYNMKQFLPTRFFSWQIQNELKSCKVSLLSCQAEFIPRLDPKCS